MANLVFKFNWEHRPYPYNFAQGKQQFMLPFASGIPNLTPDWTQVQGVGNAATKTIGADVGNVPEYTNSGLSSFGYGGMAPTSSETDLDVWYRNTPQRTGFRNAPGTIYRNPLVAGYAPSIVVARTNKTATELFLPYYASTRANQMAVIAWTHIAATDVLMKTEQIVYTSQNPVIATTNNSETSGKLVTVEGTGELRSKGFTVDSNGVFKAASPIARLFADSLELNDDAAKQSITFEKLDVGDYLIQGSLGFAKEGWYIEMPKDANGNVIVAVAYEQLENGDISVKTFKKKFDIESASIVPDYTKPIDIPAGRWIDIRLHEEPIPENLLDDLDELFSDTPVEFQPTNLAQAVAAAMDGVEPPEINEEQTNESL